MPGQTIELSDVIAAAMDARLQGVFTAMPGSVQKYYPSNQSVDVQPLVQQGYVAQGGARATERTPMVTSVPVVFPGSGGYSMTWPIQVGATGLLIFCNCSIDKWLQVGSEVDPGDDRRHCIADAVFIPGLRPFSSPIGGNNGAPTDAMVIAGPLVKIGDDNAASLGTKSDLSNLKSAISGAAVVAGDGGAAFKANILAALGAGWPAGTSKAFGT